MGGDGDGSLLRVAIAARPTIEVVRGLGGVVQCDVSRLVGVAGGICRSHAAFVQVVGDGVGVAGVEGGTQGLDQRAAEVIVCQVFDGATCACNLQRTTGSRLDCSLKGEHVAA